MSFIEIAASEGVVFTEKLDARTLIIDDIGTFDLSEFVSSVKQYAYQKKLAKISIKVKESDAIYFFQHGFKVEASIMAYYGMQDVFFVVYYLDDVHVHNQFANEHNLILEKGYESSKSALCQNEVDRVTITSGVIEQNIKGKEKIVFAGREHSLNSQSHQKRFYAQMGSKAVATACAHYDKNTKVVEFSGFSANLEFDIRQLINHLFLDMESYYLSIGCQTAYTIMPASSLAITAICIENDFEFGGRLTNELVDKSGKLDSLNTWFKRL